MKRVVSFLFSVCVAILVFSLPVEAKEVAEPQEREVQEQREIRKTTGELSLIQNGELVNAYIPGDNNAQLPVLYGTSWETELQNRIMEVLESDSEELEVYVEDLGINYEESWDEVLKICQNTINSKPDSFGLSGEVICYYYHGGDIIYVKLLQMYSSAEYKMQSTVLEIRIQEIIRDTISEDMSDLEKVLALHDFLVRECDYDYENYLNNAIPWNSYTAYGALTNGVAVCSGYAEAYSALLQRVGITSVILSSDEMNHAWNMVLLDGEWYHVDTTWDDPVYPYDGIDYAMEGKVRHEYFLRSDKEMQGLRHYGWELNYSYAGETLPVAKKENSYEGYIFRDLETAANYVDGKWYFTDWGSVVCSDIDGKNAVSHEMEEYIDYAHSIGRDLFLASGAGIYVVPNMDFNSVEPVFLCEDKEEYSELWVNEFAIKKGRLIVGLYLDWETQQKRLMLDAKSGNETEELYNVQFIGMGGNASFYVLEVTDNSLIQAPQVTRKGYLPDGWYLDSDYTKAWDFSKDVVDRNITLYMKWKDDPAEAYAIDTKNFPDEAFRKYLSETVDTDKDGLLTYRERAEMGHIDLYMLDIKSLKGIDLFPQLRVLYCSNNQINELDVSNCTRLTTLYCDNNQMKRLDISNCTALRVLNCSNNQISKLDISDCTKLFGLYCNDNQIDELDTGNSVELEELRCNNNQIVKLDLSNSRKLSEINCENNQLQKLDIDNCVDIEKVYCRYNLLKELNVSGFTNLYDLFCDNNKLQTLDLKNCTRLTNLTCRKNLLYALDVSDCPNLGWCYADGNIWNCPDVQVDVTTLSGFDVNRIVEGSLVNGKLEGNVLSPIDSEWPVGYTYDMGQAKSDYFQIQFKESVTDKFSDVAPGGWYVKAVQYVYNNGIMKGKQDDIFGTNGQLTRAELVTVLNSLAGKPQVTYKEAFTDVKKEQWYTNPVLWAYEKGIVKGYPNGKFGVADRIVRQDLAVMFYKYAALNGYDLAANAGEINKYADGNKVSDYAKSALDWAITQGIMSGKGNKGADISTYRLDPKGTATRAECASMIMKFLEMNK